MIDLRNQIEEQKAKERAAKRASARRLARDLLDCGECHGEWEGALLTAPPERLLCSEMRQRRPSRFLLLMLLLEEEEEADRRDKSDRVVQGGGAEEEVANTSLMCSTEERLPSLGPSVSPRRLPGGGEDDVPGFVGARLVRLHEVRERASLRRPPLREGGMLWRPIARRPPRTLWQRNCADSDLVT